MHENSERNNHQLRNTYSKIPALTVVITRAVQYTETAEYLFPNEPATLSMEIGV